ncbi:hypothetical protein [Haloarcula onubensis]|uniref:Zinc ribbon domain-containing protein n=1 Tax=Haloarcula onubensis TaxID=2950539 RepID=A0ABU2FNU6_9EURY|nr:hypothetical protein [Halomicroarcula sp. S3CR25-11]MDS0282430.1 hypothetical protein [Halomicroarcula sp. S3CR25-11]
MVTAGELYVLTATVMTLVALAAALPVLRDIVRDGRERLRKRPAPPVEDGDAGEAVDGVRCRHCGTVNEDGYCEECSRQL